MRNGLKSKSLVKIIPPPCNKGLSNNNNNHKVKHEFKLNKSLNAYYDLHQACHFYFEQIKLNEVNA